MALNPVLCNEMIQFPLPGATIPEVVPGHVDPKEFEKAIQAPPVHADNNYSTWYVQNTFITVNKDTKHV